MGKQVKLTQAGERLLPYALEILTLVGKAENIAQEEEEICGKLRIGTSESYVISVFSPLMMEFCEICSKVEVSTHTALVQDLFQMLRQNDIDLLYFLDQKIDFPEWIKVIEKPERIVFAASAESALAGEKKYPWKGCFRSHGFLRKRESVIAMLWSSAWQRKVTCCILFGRWEIRM